MKLIKVRAKVRLYSEEDLELISREIQPKEELWGKRTVAFFGSDVYRLVNHSPGTCIIVFNDWEKLLVYEPFSQVMNKWQECIKKDKPEEPAEEEEATSGEDKDEDEE